MISKLFVAVFTPKYPRGYTGRHRAESAARSRTVRTEMITAHEVAA